MKPPRKRPGHGDGRKPKLTPQQAAELRAWAAGRMTLREKAASLGIGLTTARNYINGAHAGRLAT